ncbi:MAG: hypothetical protein GQ564_15075 [Bacteroidales bacterium]|nr:hypothetical protein [Bacteroidales bacterium]
MKNIINIYTLFFIGLLLLNACNEESSFNELDELSMSIDKIETSYIIGDEKVESLYVSGMLKDETIASEEHMAQLIQDHERLYKNNVRLKYSGYDVAVFKSGTCSTSRITIKLDCEDSGNSSSVSGWSGDSFEDSNGNIWLVFCACNHSQFTNYGFHGYAVLQISDVNYLAEDLDQIHLYLDNEDSSNSNNIYIDGVSQGQNSTILYPTKITANTHLYWIYYPQSSSGSFYFPKSFASSYGVLGDFNNNYAGYIYSDDEDYNNDNYDVLNNTTYNPSGFSNIYSSTANTKFYITQILNGVAQ